jgi:hypothetical protein
MGAYLRPTVSWKIVIPQAFVWASHGHLVVMDMSTHDDGEASHNERTKQNRHDENRSSRLSVPIAE